MGLTIDEICEMFAAKMESIESRMIDTGSSVHSISVSPSVANLQSKLPEENELPEKIQTFLTYLEDLDLIEKINLVHDFVNTEMKYPENTGDIYHTDRILSNKQILQNWSIGDCDNKAQLAACLLRYSGFEANKLVFIGGNTAYNDGKAAGHAALLIEYDDQVFLSDMNLGNVETIEITENLSVKASGFTYLNSGHEVIEFSMDPSFLIPIDSAEQGMVDPAFVEKVSHTLGLNKFQVMHNL